MSVQRRRFMHGVCLAGAFLASQAGAQGEGPSTSTGAPAVSLSGATPWVETGGGGCFIFFDKQEFEQFNAADGKVLKGIEDFEESIIPDGAKQVLPAPLMGNVPNVDPVTGFGFPFGLTEKNIIIQDNIFPGPNPPDVFPSGSPFALFVIGPGFIGSNSKKVGEDLEVLTGQSASTDLIFTEPNHTGVGFELSHFAGFGNGLWHISVYNKNDVEICKVIVPDPPPGINEPSKVFVGVWTPETIGRINIWDEGIIPDAIDNIQLWEEQTHPCPWDCGIPHNKFIDVIDFLALLSQWGQVGAPCDFGLGAPGVDVVDFLKLLSQWGQCPVPANDECPGTQITRSEPVGVIEVHFDMYGATASPFPYQCFPAPPIFKDIWYCLVYQPIQDVKKNVRIATSVPLGIEVTAGCQCPPGPVIACGFGADGTPQFSMQPGDAVQIRLVNVQNLPNDLLKGLMIIENKIPPSPLCTVPARIDFGVTLDDFGASNDCIGAPTVITTQYVLSQSIVFGTAVDNFGPPPVAILGDGACVPACRSSGMPPFTSDWWCQFKVGTAPGVPGSNAGVPVFSAQVCFIDAAPGAILMEGYNNDRALIATVSNMSGGTEVLTILAPAGDLIAYVRVVSSNPARPAGLSIDCLDYPDPTKRVDINFFEDPGQFFQALAQTEKLEKFFWDFKPHDLAGGIPALNGPLDINTHGADPQDPWTDPAGANLWPPFVDNVQFNSNMTPQGPFTPRNLDAMAFVYAGGFPGVNNNALVANFFVDSFEIVSGPPAGDNHTAFALDILSLAGPLPTTIHVTVYDKNDLELGKYILLYDGGKRFLGILTKDQVTIGRIDIWDVGNGAEGVSAISAFAKPNPFGCPAPGSCCVVHNTPACDNTDCCRRVCALDPFCCNVVWDQICADEALQFPQCGCANECQPAGVCGTHVQCGVGTPFNCFCFEVDFMPAPSPGKCIQDFFCTGIPCPPGGCPPGFVCVTNSCCGIPECAPIIKCEPVPADAGPVAIPAEGGLTGSGAWFDAPK